MNIRSTPWITDNSYHHLNDFINKNKNANVLEFGAGASTVWFNNNPNVKKIISVEHDEKWFQIIKNKIDPNKTTLHCLPRPYHEICHKIKETFDVILVDGRNRNKCFAACLKLLKTGGIIVFDNTERQYYSPSFELWIKSRLGDVTRYMQFGPDITGWAAPHRWETTIFFKKSK